MANIQDDHDNVTEPHQKRGKAWLIFGLGLVAAAGFGWQFFANSGQSVGSLLGASSSPDSNAANGATRPQISGKISTGTNGEGTTPAAPMPTMTSNSASVTPADSLATPAPGSANAIDGKPVSGTVLAGKMTKFGEAESAPPMSTPAPPATATAKVADAAKAPAAAKTAAVTKSPELTRIADVAKPKTTEPVKMTPPGDPKGTPISSLKMDKEFRSLLYAVFYRWASADLGKSGRSTVARLIPEALKGNKIVLTGRTDITGDAGLNKILAERRANSIKQAFVKKGVNASIIESNINTSGESKLAEGTVTPLLPKAGNNRARRVDIYIEAKDGSSGGMKQ